MNSKPCNSLQREKKQDLKGKSGKVLKAILKNKSIRWKIKALLRLHLKGPICTEKAYHQS